MPVNTSIQSIETELTANSENIAAIRLSKSEMLNLLRNYRDNDLLTVALIYTNNTERSLVVYASDTSAAPSGEQPYGYITARRMQVFCPPDCNNFTANTLSPQ